MRLGNPRRPISRPLFQIGEVLDDLAELGAELLRLGPLLLDHLVRSLGEEGGIVERRVDALDVPLSFGPLGTDCAALANLADASLLRICQGERVRPFLPVRMVPQSV